jgi:NAD(P)-dependent dehydrogenase (short-subunit alcohol dehydrogenase family)
MKDFKNKVAVITGAAGGLGQGLAIEFARKGSHIAMCDIADMSQTLEQLKSFGVKVYHEKVDIGDKRAIDKFSENVIDFFGYVDILINNAGMANGDRLFEELTEKDFEKITNINYWGVIHTTMKFYPHLIKRPQAAIANISSSQGVLPLPYLVSYCTTKFAVRGFTDTLRVEHQVRGINNVTVHTVHPGAMATNITINADYHNANTEYFHKRLQKGTTPKEAANIIINGIQKNKVRIFISSGRPMDILARLIPSSVHHVILLVMWMRGVQVR